MGEGTGDTVWWLPGKSTGNRYALRGRSGVASILLNVFGKGGEPFPGVGGERGGAGVWVVDAKAYGIKDVARGCVGKNSVAPLVRVLSEFSAQCLGFSR